MRNKILFFLFFLFFLPLSLPPPPPSTSSLNGKEELITAGEGKGATLTKTMQLTSTDPTIVPLTENTIINPAAVRVRP